MRPGDGCDTVAASEYATVIGLPVALYGVVFSIVLIAACLAWWRGARPWPCTWLTGWGWPAPSRSPT